ncbi:MAG: hypothetical protein GF411_08500 [Candidatus Lokiarchaeota archaeon]|nr:hypothetical protein [Candidatus Lokiarchaeota archaeon]
MNYINPGVYVKEIDVSFINFNFLNFPELLDEFAKGISSQIDIAHNYSTIDISSEVIFEPIGQYRSVCIVFFDGHAKIWDYGINNFTLEYNDDFVSKVSVDT